MKSYSLSWNTTTLTAPLLLPPTALARAMPTGAREPMPARAPRRRCRPWRPPAGIPARRRAGEPPTAGALLRTMPPTWRAPSGPQDPLARARQRWTNCELPLTRLPWRGLPLRPPRAEARRASWGQGGRPAPGGRRGDDVPPALGDPRGPLATSSPLRPRGPAARTQGGRPAPGGRRRAGVPTAPRGPGGLMIADPQPRARAPADPSSCADRGRAGLGGGGPRPRPGSPPGR